MRKLPKFIWLRELILHNGASFSKNVYLTCKGESYTVAYGGRSHALTKVFGNFKYYDEDSVKRIYLEDGYPEEFIKMWEQYSDFLYKKQKK